MFLKMNSSLSYYSDKSLSINKVITVTLLFFIISLIGIIYHEFWLDESHNFLLARDSNSLSDLLYNSRYEGQPQLWNYFIHIITRFSNSPFYMQLLHIIISAVTVFIFLKKAPFQFWFKIAFILSYFTLYEYNIISRNYNLGVLFLFICCTLYEKRKEYFTLFCFFLALSSNTHSLFVIASGALLFSIFIEQIVKFKNITSVLKNYWKGYLVFLIGVFISFWQIIPESDTLFFDRIDYSNIYEIAKSGMSLFKALFPIVDFSETHYWNRFYLIEHFKFLSFFLGIIVWIIPLLLFNKNKYVLLYIYTVLLGFIIFMYVTQMYGTRYNGLLFIVLIVGLWILPYKKDDPFYKKDISRYNSKIITLLMSVQVIAGVLAYTLDIKNTFNHGENVAKYIQDNNIPLKQIITNCESASINAFLPENLYNICHLKPQGFYLWNKNCELFDINLQESLIQTAFFQKTNQKTLFLILNDPLKLSNPIEIENNIYSFSVLNTFENSVKHNYYLYKVFKNESK